VNSSGGIFKRCGCRLLETGQLTSSTCPHLAERNHGSWYFDCAVAPCPDGGSGAWLLDGEETVADVFNRYKHACRGSGDDANRLRVRLDAVTAFAQATLTRAAYQRLQATLTGRAAPSYSS
jgi:hypothetical protein